jgi:hypothetical protein
MNHRARDPYASSPAAYATVALGIAAAVFAAYAIAADWSPWAVGPIVFVCAPLAAIGAYHALSWAGARREARGHYDRARAKAYRGRPPGAREVLDDLAAARDRFNAVPPPRRYTRRP